VQRNQVLDDAPGQGAEVVAAFQAAHETSAAERVGAVAEQAGDLAKASSLRLSCASGSSRWASKPAETSRNWGLNASRAGRTRDSKMGR